MKQIMKRSCFLGIVFLLLFSTLLGAVACTPKKPNDDFGKKEEPEEMTNLTIGGKSIANHVIVYSGDSSLAMTVRSAISQFATVTPVATTKMPEDGKAIWLKVDAQQSPASCRVYVEGERTLVLAVHTANFMEQAVALFCEQLVGETLDFPKGFSVSRAYTAIPYQSSKQSKALIGDANKNPLSYEIGEAAIFSIAAVAGNQLLSIPYFHVETWNEATGKGTDEYLDGSKGYIEYHIQNFNKAGFFYFNVNACDENKAKITGFDSSADNSNHFVGSVGFGVSKIGTAAQMPSDFDSFWADVVSEVKSQSMANMKLTKLSSTQAGYVTYYWQTPTGGQKADREDKVAAGYLTYPVGASETSKIGLKIEFQAHSDKIPIPNPDYQENTAVLIVCAHGFDLEKAKANVSYYSKQRSIIGSFINEEYFREMIKRDLFGVRFLVEYFGESRNNYWDGETFEVRGASMGAMQSTAVAALAKQVTGKDVSLLDIHIPWLCDVKGSAGGRKPRTWPSNIADLEHFDPANFAHLMTCKVQIYAALGDQYCPSSGVTALYNQLHCEKTITYQQNTSHSGGVGGEKYIFSESN